MTKRSRCSHRYSALNMSQAISCFRYVVVELPGIRGAWSYVLDFASVTTHHMILPGSASIALLVRFVLHVTGPK